MVRSIGRDSMLAGITVSFAPIELGVSGCDRAFRTGSGHESDYAFDGRPERGCENLEPVRQCRAVEERSDWKTAGYRPLVGFGRADSTEVGAE